MGGNPPSVELKDRIEAEESLKARGFTASCGPTGGVVVDRWNHVRGVWHFHAGNFYWTPAGYNEPSYRTESLEAALRFAVDVICKA